MRTEDDRKVLGVSENATDEDIHRAWRKLAAKHHPDRGGNTEAFHRITRARDRLLNPAEAEREDARANATSGAHTTQTNGSAGSAGATREQATRPPWAGQHRGNSQSHHQQPGPNNEFWFWYSDRQPRDNRKVRQRRANPLAFSGIAIAVVLAALAARDMVISALYRVDIGALEQQLVWVGPVASMLLLGLAALRGPTLSERPPVTRRWALGTAFVAIVAVEAAPIIVPVAALITAVLQRRSGRTSDPYMIG